MYLQVGVACEKGGLAVCRDGMRECVEGVGLLEAKAKEASSKELAKEVKYDLMKPAEVRADLMQASG